MSHGGWLPESWWLVARVMVAGRPCSWWLVARVNNKPSLPRPPQAACTSPSCIRHWRMSGGRGAASHRRIPPHTHAPSWSHRHVRGTGGNVRDDEWGAGGGPLQTSPPPTRPPPCPHRHVRGTGGVDDPNVVDEAGSNREGLVCAACEGRGWGGANRVRSGSRD